MGNKDPWANRNKGMKCETCMYFVEKKSDETKLELGECGAFIPKVSDGVITRVSLSVNKKLFGRCRRNAPTMKGFPVYGDDWCGEHRLDENKI